MSAARTFYLVDAAGRGSPFLWDGESPYTPPAGCTVSENYVPPPESAAPVPAEVALWRIKAVADLAGLTAQIEAAIDAMQEPARSVARRAWNDGNVMVRSSPTVAALSSGLGLTSEQVDDLFRQAEGLEA